ncbi:trypsin-like peptidase domain-containing protein, partial [Leptolyngbya sp. FACHB-36]|uniref:S1C family serine protease n=1 Tax=Leptolyngbya sp. FACHB-36 TaxID=2692808 RepID=UPI001681293B
MNFKYFLLLAAPILLADVSPSISLPTQTAPRSIAASNASDTYRNCQQSAAAVVTIYSGREIGSGSIISADGVVITNHHVVQESVRSGGRKQIYVKLASGDRYTGQILGTDTRNDLALVKLAAQKSFPTVPFAGLQPQAGQGVCAIGSPYG